ncbi:MAG: hypothetical protein ACI8Z1_000742 [Candidatus Azotimanducaceae bacterium]|jgi:hypothetical protein
MTRDDFIETDLLYPDRTGEIYSLAYKSSRRWFYVSDMQPNEAMLLKCYDSELVGALEVDCLWVLYYCRA